MCRGYDVNCARGLRLKAAGLVGTLIAILFFTAAASGQSSEALVKVIAKEPATAVWMLAAPHIGKRICQVQTSTLIRFIAHARHGPHQFARVEVLEGECAGKQGYVPWSVLQPKPQ